MFPFNKNSFVTFFFLFLPIKIHSLFSFSTIVMLINSIRQYVTGCAMHHQHQHQHHNLHSFIHHYHLKYFWTISLSLSLFPFSIGHNWSWWSSCDHDHFVLIILLFKSHFLNNHVLIVIEWVILKKCRFFLYIRKLKNEQLYTNYLLYDI